MANQKISAVLIVKDEAKPLEGAKDWAPGGDTVLSRCLRSLKDADQIVVLDTGSTDGSVEIAKECGADVYTTDPIVPFHFGEARNRALAHAKHDWCITIDADEIARPGAIKLIKKHAARHPDATAMNITFVMRGELSDTPYPIMKTKVFRKSTMEWKYRIHELLFQKPGAGEPRYTELPEAVFEHLPPPEKEGRHGQNLELLKLCVRESPEYARAFRQLALEYMLRKQHREAMAPMIKWLHYLEAAGIKDPFERSEACCHLGECEAALGEIDKAQVWFQAAHAAARNRREPFYRAGRCLMAVIRPADAIPWFEKALEIPLESKPDFHLNMASVWRPGGAVEEALILAFLHTNRIDEAKSLLIALSVHPEGKNARFHLDQDPAREATIEDVLEYCRAKEQGVV